MTQDADFPPDTGQGAHSRRWALLAGLVFSLAAAWIFAPVWWAGATRVAPAPHAEGPWKLLETCDLKAEAWIVSRGAYTLVHRPLQFFDSEHCAPAEKSLAYGPAMLTMAILSIPAYLATGDPVLIYNVDLVLLCLIGAAAMYLLIAEWSGVPAAGIVAGLLFAFHRTPMRDISHAMDWNLAWTVFALFFARRLFAHGRWRDAAGLALVVSLQIWESIYTLLAAMVLSAPFAVWLLARYRFRTVRLAQLAFVGTSIVLASAMFFAPYLQVQTLSGALHRSEAQQNYAPLQSYLPDAWFFVGWLPVALAGCSLLFGRKRTVAGLSGGDPRGALLTGGLSVALVAAGPHVGSLLQSLTGNPSLDLPNFFLLLARVIPGLDAIRKIGCLSSGFIFVTCALAGMGAAALIRLSRRYGALAAAALVLAAALDVTRPSMLGLPPTHEWDLHSIAADKNSMQFFRDLEQLGNNGAVLELPVGLGLAIFTIGVSRVSLSFYHHRRTSACMGSFDVPGREAFTKLADRLPALDAVNEIRRLGFTTVILDSSVAGLDLWRRFMQEANHPESTGIRLLYASGTIHAFTLEPTGEQALPQATAPP